MGGKYSYIKHPGTGCVLFSLWLKRIASQCISGYENYNMEQRLEWNYHGPKAFTQWWQPHKPEPRNDDNTLGSACAVLLLYIMYVSFILLPTHQQRWQIGNYSLRQWTLISATAVYCQNEECLSFKVTRLCVLFNSSFTVVELCMQFLKWWAGGCFMMPEFSFPRGDSAVLLIITLDQWPLPVDHIKGEIYGPVVRLRSCAAPKKNRRVSGSLVEYTRVRLIRSLCAYGGPCVHMCLSPVDRIKRVFLGGQC